MTKNSPISKLFGDPGWPLLGSFYSPRSQAKKNGKLKFSFNNSSSHYRSPSISRIRAKMLYATSKALFRQELDGVHYEIQATDPTEMDIEVIRDRAH